MDSGSKQGLTWQHAIADSGLTAALQRTVADKPAPAADGKRWGASIRVTRKSLHLMVVVATITRAHGLRSRQARKDVPRPRTRL
jgi:hypothetical protein